MELDTNKHPALFHVDSERSRPLDSAVPYRAASLCDIRSAPHNRLQIM